MRDEMREMKNKRRIFIKMRTSYIGKGSVGKIGTGWKIERRKISHRKMQKGKKRHVTACS